MYKFGSSSKKTLNTVNEYLIMAADRAISESKIDISIPEWGGFRTSEYQFELYKKKWSRADGTQIRSNHQNVDDKGKSLALDLCGYYKGKQTWNGERLCYIAVLMLKSFKYLKHKGVIPEDKYIHWGGYWSTEDDGMGWDLPHFELRNKPQTKIFVA